MITRKEEIDSTIERSFKYDSKIIIEEMVEDLVEYLNLTYIPVEDGNYYTVKKGDTLYKIASQNNTTVDILKELNNLSTNNLSIGQQLKLPPTEIIEIPSTTITYTVKPGDTLYALAKTYNTTVDAIKTINNLTTNILSIGQTLIISP